MNRPYNFSAGPAVLPEEVLRQAQQEMLDWQGSGMCVMEMSHRSKEFISIAEQAETDFRTLLNVPDHYKVLFMQGGATAQFSLVPLNLLGGKASADYINTGQWSTKAIKEAQRYCDVNVVASSAEEGFTCIPARGTWQVNADAAYFHYTPNETIGGVEFFDTPEVDVPLVADMSSTILSRPVDVTKFGVIYAGAQKNIGPAGLTLVVIDEALLGKAAAATPSIFDYQKVAAADSMLNTPPTYTWYIAGLVFKWLLDKGGLEQMAITNKEKAEKLYAAIDSSNFYVNKVDITCRSWMNIPFILKNPELDAAFLSEAKEAGLTTLKGHRSVGGMRASIYNAMPEEGVDTLIGFMKEFERTKG